MVVKPHLCVFFTKDVSLRTWAETGMLEREIAIYRWLQDKGVKVSFVTYGNKTDLAYADRLSGINILCNRWNMRSQHYTRWLPVLHATHLARVTVIKTNQMNGSEHALHVSWFWRKPLIARCGYMWSDFEERRYGVGSPQAVKASRIECDVFAAADAIVVTTPMMVENVVQRLPDAKEKVHLLPNYVETDRFRPIEGELHYDVIFVGRLEPQKNVGALLEALGELPQVTAAIVGSGSLEAEFKQQYSGLGNRITWLGNVPNSELPMLINRSRIFILPSHYEGHPKALIEAMSCGVAVIGSNVPGICEIVSHGENALLTETDPKSIRDALQALLSDASLRERLGTNARSFVLKHYALDTIGQKELQIMDKVSQ